MPVLSKERDKFRIRRSVRTEDLEDYLILHQDSNRKRAYCGEILVIQDKKRDHFDIKALLLADELDWKKVCYKDKVGEVNLSGVLVDEIEDIVESWGGGSWYLALFEGVTGDEYSGEV